MKNHMWFPLAMLLWLVLCHHNLYVNAQSEVAIGAYRTFERTSFSCKGRPSGYYADIETGCQIYHMCDGLGRQFSYSCPNTTLFQQRMLICDHWYMVNCSKAESDYTANLLIGQRDKPFVNDEDANLRTPRPDLLDRPYAPDYSGESFRSQYQKPLSNVIYDNGRNKLRDKIKPYENHYNVGQQHWKIPQPSRAILPPAFEPQIYANDANNLQTKKSLTTKKPSTYTTVTAATTKFHHGADALHQRTEYQHIQYDNDDLGTSHSTRYNTSADININVATDIRNHKTKEKVYSQNKYTYNTISNARITTTQQTTTTKPKAAISRTSIGRTSKSTAETHIKVPSKIYEPPLPHDSQNIEDQVTTVGRPLIRSSTSQPFTKRLSSPTTVKPNSKPTTIAGKPFTQTSVRTTPSKAYLNQHHHADIQALNKAIKTVASAHGFHAPTTTTPIPLVKNYSKDNNDVEAPSKTLLPPLQDFITHDVATTQGPPIYYEWKVPSEGLEPPKLDSPIGVNGREYPDIVIDYNTLYSSKHSNTTQNVSFKKFSNTNNEKKNSLFNIFKNSSPNNKTLTNEIIQPKPAASNKTPTAQLLPAHTHSRTHTRLNGGVTKTDISEIRKEWSIPEYAFPLESDGRTGYSSSDIYNSFQLKIPDGHNAADEHLHWFGENPDCPECHPSYVKPGTCEPCLRR